MSSKYAETHRRSHKNWKKNHPDQVRRERRDQKVKDQNATLPKANNQRRPWKAEEVAILRREGERLSIKELAAKLGRTYFGIQMKAFHEGISLTGDKVGGNASKFKK